MVKIFYLLLNLILQFIICSYINCEIFPVERIEKLKKIIDDNSEKDEHLLTYSEYKAIVKDNFHINDAVTEFYKGKVAKLIEKIEDFVRYKLSKPIAEETLMGKIVEEIKILANKKTNIEVISCKLFMIELYTDNAEGTFLHLETFIKKGEEKSFQWLKKIFDNSIVQNEEIDELVNLAMISAHIQNKEQNKMNAESLDGNKKKQIEKILIEGGGPNGLYAAIEFFMSGMSITLVNDRIGYTRDRPISLYGQWIVRKNFLCTTKNKDKLIWDTNYIDLVQFDLKLDLFNVYLKELETMMKDRLESLMEFNKKWKLLRKNTLILLYETEIKSIAYSFKLGHFANLGLRKKSMNYQNLRKSKMEEFIQVNSANFTSQIEEKWKKQAEKWIHKEKMKNIQRLLEIKYGREINEYEKIILKENEKISAYELAELEMTENGGEEWMKLREYPKIQFDLLLCAGGVNDRIRTELLGVRTLMEVPRKYASTTFISNKFAHKFDSKVKLVIKKLDEISLQRQKIDEFIKSCVVLPKEFKEKYKNMNEMLCKNSIKTSSIILHQNSEIFQLTIEIAQYFAEFLEEIDKLKKEASENAEKIQKFRNGILRKWFAAIFYTLLKMQKVNIDETAELNMDQNGEPIGDKFDPNKINFDRFNLSVFDVSIRTPEMPVKLFLNGKEKILFNQFKNPLKLSQKKLIGSSSRKSTKNIKNSAIVIAIGDANVNMDFLRGEALSVGRLSIENIANFVKKYNHGKIKSENDLIELIYYDLRRWQTKSFETSMEISKKLQTKANEDDIRQTNRMDISKLNDKFNEFRQFQKTFDSLFGI